jgi:DHA3 family macrolide efflux protein-like MFS transporter
MGTQKQETKPVVKGPSGMLGFTIVWAGQIVSVLASNMSGFGLSIWAYQKYHSATILGGTATAFLLPFLLVSPFAGAMVDRYNRKLMMMISDLGAVLATTAMLILNGAGRLEIWHIYVACVVFGLSGTFQWPAYMAAITTMVPKEQYTRANGMMTLVDSGPSVFAPVMAGALIPVIGLTGILTIDVITFFIAIGSLLIVHVPQPEKTVEGQLAKGNLAKEAAYGFKYIFQRKPLLYLLLSIVALNLVHGLSNSLFTPFILSRTNSSTAMGTVQTFFALGGVVGGLIVSAWGGFKKRIRGMLLGWAWFGVFGLIIFGLGRTMWIWLPAAFLGSMAFPLTQSASNSIWQTKVAPDVQGRVFSARRMMAWVTEPIMPIVAGLMADYVTEPAMTGSTSLAKTFGGLVGTTTGSGMALQYLLSGILYLGIIVIVWFIPLIRNVETILPDHDKMKKLEEGKGGEGERTTGKKPAIEAEEA